MNVFLRLKQRFDRFMLGRNGHDYLNRCLIWLWLIEAIINLFLRSFVLSLLGTVFCLIIFYRMFSKNLVKRRRENAAWYTFSQKATEEIKRLRVRIRDRKLYHFFRCPNCKAPIRMPKVSGVYNVRCQKCGSTFKKAFK